MPGALSLNLIRFANLLRRAGLPVGTSETLAAQQALALVDIARRGDVRAALAATLLRRHEHRDLFDAAFDLFWRAPSETAEGPPGEPEAARPGDRRLAEALAERDAREAPPGERREQTMTASAAEALRKMDFEAMGATEIDAAKQAIRRLSLPLDARKVRRWRPDPSGPRIDLRATLRAGLRRGGEVLELRRTRRRTRPPPLVVLCDISGSMAAYAQILLHFLHAVANDRDRVHVFLFGTRLSNVTRQLRHRDPEIAFQLVAGLVPDWSGGTRIGAALEQFNRVWARRVLAQGAVVLLMTDGLDRDPGTDLGRAMDRLHRSARRLIWLNPLLRWDGFQPRSAGIRAMLPHVDEFRTIHSLESIEALVDLLSRPSRRGSERRMAA